MFITFFLPSYNEEQILEKSSLKLLYFLKNKNYDFNWNIVLLLNGSTDKSEQIANKLISDHKEIKKYIIKEKGRGNAIKKFLDYSTSDYNIYMDVDLAVSLENINQLLLELIENKNDLVFGSRLKRGAHTDRSFIRELSSRSYILLSKIILKHSFSDLQCGFKGIKKEAWQRVSPFVKDKKWFFDTELIAFTKKFNFKITEVPVDWSENRYEKRKSKVRVLKDSLIFIQELIKLKKRLNKRDD